MPRIPNFVAGSHAPRAGYPNEIGGTEILYGAQTHAANALARFGVELANLAGNLQAQKNEIEFTDLSTKYKLAQQDLALRLPAQLAAEREARGESADYSLDEHLRELQTRSQTLLEGFTDKASNNAVKGALQRYGQATYGKLQLGVQAEGIAREKMQVLAKLDGLGETQLQAAAQAQTAAGREQAIGMYVANLRRAEGYGLLGPEDVQKKASVFQQRAIERQMSTMRQHNPARLFELEAQGAFDGLDVKRRDEIMDRAGREFERRQREANALEAKAQKEDEERVANAREDRKIQIGSLITTGKLGEARAMLDFHEELRTLDAKSIEHLRDEIAKPARTVPSDPAIAGRILLDVESISPRTTEAQIDEMFARYQKGEPGLSLVDATRAKNQLRSTRMSLQDKNLTEINKQHAQAEQELRAQLGIKPGLAAAARGDDPADRLYAVLLPELRQRSRAFNPNGESPLAVVESMTPRIQNALGKPAMLRPSEILGLYPDFQSLERARRENKISESAYEEQIQMRQAPSGAGAPQAPAPGAPAGAPAPAKPGTPRKRF